MMKIEGWYNTLLGELVTLIKGISYASEDYCGPGEGSVFLTIKCVSKAGGFKSEGIKFYKGPIAPSQILKPGELLIANTDLTRAGDIVGCPMLVPKIDGENITMSMDLSKLVEDDSKVDRYFLYYKLMTDSIRNFMKDHASGSTVLHLQTRAVPGLELEIPSSKPEQAKIAEILSTVDHAIEQTEALIAKQQHIKTGLMQDLLTRGIDEHGNLRSEQTHQFKDSPLGRIPVEWEVSPAHSLCIAVIDCKNRTPPERKDGHPVIRTPNVRAGKFVFDDLLYTDERSYEVWTVRGKPKAGDVVITREAPFGEACVIPEDLGEPCLGQRIMMYQPDPTRVRNDFLLYAIYSERVQKRLLELAGGSTVGHIKVGEIRNLELPHPLSLEEQDRITHVLNEITNALKQYSLDLTMLMRLKTALMQDLLTGKKRVIPLLNPRR